MELVTAPSLRSSVRWELFIELIELNIHKNTQFRRKLLLLGIARVFELTKFSSCNQSVILLGL